MLVLLLSNGDQRFALDAREVVEVVPSVPLRPVPAAPAWIAGLLHHRGDIVPVVDLARLSRGLAAAPRLSTRIVVLRRRDTPDAGLIGVLAEGVTETARIDPAALRDPGVRASDAPWLGRIALDGGALVQLVRWTDLVPADLRAAVLEGGGA
ncbi:MAG: chemotaxis protein CheW [Candidatus Binatia bacterium]